MREVPIYNNPDYAINEIGEVRKYNSKNHRVFNNSNRKGNGIVISRSYYNVIKTVFWSFYPEHVNKPVFSTDGSSHLDKIILLEDVNKHPNMRLIVDGLKNFVVFDTGEIWSVCNNSPLLLSEHGKRDLSHPSIFVNGKSQYVAKLVYEAFVEPIPSPAYLTFLDGNVLNCRLSNLIYRAGVIAEAKYYNKGKLYVYDKHLCHIDGQLISRRTCLPIKATPTAYNSMMVPVLNNDGVFVGMRLLANFVYNSFTFGEYVESADIVYIDGNKENTNFNNLRKSTR